MFYLLAQNTDIEYKAMIAHRILKIKCKSPFDLRLLGVENHYFFPWAGQTFEFGVWCMLLAVFFFWVSVRINTAQAYRNIAWCLLGFGAFVSFFYDTAFPNAGIVFVTGVLLLMCAVNVATVMSVAAVQYLPYLGVQEDHLTRPSDGSVTYVPSIVACLLTVLTPFIVSPLFAEYYYSLLNHNDNLFYISIALFLVLAFLLSRHFLPWQILEDHPILGGGFMKELAPIFKLNGPASRAEIVVVGLFLCVMYVSALVLLRGTIDGTDIIGVIIIISMGFAILRAEMRRTAQSQEEVRVKRTRNAWT